MQFTVVYTRTNWQYFNFLHRATSKWKAN